MVGGLTCCPNSSRSDRHSHDAGEWDPLNLPVLPYHHHLSILHRDTPNAAHVAIDEGTVARFYDQPRTAFRLGSCGRFLDSAWCRSSPTGPPPTSGGSGFVRRRRSCRFFSGLRRWVFFWRLCVYGARSASCRTPASGISRSWPGSCYFGRGFLRRLRFRRWRGGYFNRRRLVDTSACR